MRKVLLSLLTLGLPLAAAQDYVFGITYDAGGKFDGSFNEGTFNGLSKAVKELKEDDRLAIDVLEFEGSPDTAAEGQRSMASKGAELVIAPGFLQYDAITSVSREFPDSDFLLIDAAPATAEEATQYPNVQFVLFKEHEGSYLVGYLAGKMTQTGTVGFVGGMDIPLIHAFEPWLPRRRQGCLPPTARSSLTTSVRRPLPGMIRPAPVNLRPRSKPKVQILSTPPPAHQATASLTS